MIVRMRRLLTFLAAAGLGAYAYWGAESRVYQASANRAFTRMLEMPDALRPPPDYTKDWQARLEIPRIDLETMILRGANRSNLSRGIVHIEGTALPGTGGNVGLAAHRDTFFRRLGELEVGDRILVRTLNDTYDYKVERIQVVDPSAVDVLRDVGTPALTLVTCYPFHYIGPAPKRYVVTAVMRQSAELR
jgi:LPXTG-site transpeptidase (sortase) family protein